MNASSLIGRIPPVTKNLLVINILIWAVMALIPDMRVSIDKYFALHYFTSSQFGFWQVFTYMFLHDGFTHLFFNMFALLMFGGIIERSMGSARFLLYYVSCGIGAALIQLGVFAYMLSDLTHLLNPEQLHLIIDKGLVPPDVSMERAGEIYSIVNTPIVGASGAIFGVLLAFGMLFPNQPLFLMFIPVPIKAKWMVLGYGAIELFYGVSGTAPGIAHWAHLGGMIVGVFMILYWKKKGVFRDRWFF